MSRSKRFSVLRDPVHGDVYLTHEELRVLDTPEMQRLRGIKQLGTAYLVYPGAVHTRFDHSIGTVHVAQKMIEAIRLSFDLDPAGSLSISEEEARVIRIAALLHDVAHIPHGHSIEDQDGLFERHDTPYRFQRLFDPARPLGKVLRELGVYEDVFSILTEPGTEGRREVPAYWSQLIGGTIAADILDYLARDAYFTGLWLEVDPRVTSYFKIDRASGNLYIDLAKHALLREDILSEIVRMLEARYYFSERVYYHHAKVCAGALVARAVEELVGAEALREEDLQDQTDASVLDVLDRTARDAGREINLGTFSYPVLMAADILIYDSHHVPVGKDQKQHVEMARDMAAGFNHRYGADVFVLPEPLIREEVATVPGVDGRKMSKSYDNTLPLFLPPKELRKRIMKIVTDSKGGWDSIVRSEGANLGLSSARSAVQAYVAKDASRTQVGALSGWAQTGTWRMG